MPAIEINKSTQRFSKNTATKKFDLGTKERLDFVGLVKEYQFALTDKSEDVGTSDAFEKQCLLLLLFEYDKPIGVAHISPHSRGGRNESPRAQIENLIDISSRNGVNVDAMRAMIITSKPTELVERVEQALKAELLPEARKRYESNQLYTAMVINRNGIVEIYGDNPVFPIAFIKIKEDGKVVVVEISPLQYIKKEVKSLLNLNSSSPISLKARDIGKPLFDLMIAFAARERNLPEGTVGIEKEIINNGTILDLGCGVQHYLLDYLRKRGADIIGVDNHEDFKNDPAKGLYKIDAQDLFRGLEGEGVRNINTVISTAVFNDECEWLYNFNRERVIEELYKILNFGGQVYIAAVVSKENLPVLEKTFRKGFNYGEIAD